MFIVGHAPTNFNEKFPSYFGSLDLSSILLYNQWDTTWSFMRSLDPTATSTPTWSAFNSLLTDNTEKTAYHSLPLLRSSPTDWSTFYTALCICQDLSTSTAPGRKTIISLDMLLYIKAIQLKTNDNINRNFIFRVGELHTVMHFLDAMGTYIDGSGLDQAVVEAGSSGPVTFERIKDGKELQRALELHTVLYLTLHSRYYIEFFFENNEGIVGIIDIVRKYIDDTPGGQSCIDVERLREIKTRIIDKLNSELFYEKLQAFEEDLGKQATFYRNYMKMFELLLLFIRGTRQRLWELHLASLHKLVKYFFAHDKQNYARMVPVYLSEMYALKGNHPEVWEFFLKGNFSVNKANVPFSAIGADHGIEHENRAMKVMGGIRGLAYDPQALERLFLASPELNTIVEDFSDKYGLKSREEKNIINLSVLLTNFLAKTY